MATEKEITEHLKIALKEVGQIEPWFDKECGEWVFSNPLYPVEYAGRSKEEVVENYPKYLREFICHRLDRRLELGVERKTKGRGGARTRAERPRRTRRAPSSKVVRLEENVAEWVQENLEEIRSLLSGEKVLVRTKRKKRKRAPNRSRMRF